VWGNLQGSSRVMRALVRWQCVPRYQDAAWTAAGLLMLDSHPWLAGNVMNEPRNPQAQTPPGA
jgi:hypothetical protein